MYLGGGAPHRLHAGPSCGIVAILSYVSSIVMRMGNQQQQQYTYHRIPPHHTPERCCKTIAHDFQCAHSQGIC